MPWTNLHSHTNYSDGSDDPGKYIEEALSQRLHTYGFSCHAPVPFESHWSMKREKLSNYLVEIARLSQKYNGQIRILHSLEIDYIPGMISPSDAVFKESGLDYTIGSVHFVDAFDSGIPWGIDGSLEIFEKGLNQVWQSDIQKVVKRYFSLVREMISLSKPTIIAHLDKIRMHNENDRYFSESASWYRQEVLQTLDLISVSKSFLEINTRGMYRGGKTEPYPSIWILKEAKKRKIPLVLNSDAHSPQEITGMFSETSVLLHEAGIRNLHCPGEGGWKGYEFDHNGLFI